MKYIHCLLLTILFILFIRAESAYAQSPTVTTAPTTTPAPASCQMPTSCQFNKTASHVISPFPCWDGNEPIFSTPENASGLNYNTITVDDAGTLVGGGNCGGAANCTTTLILQNPDPTLPAKGIWWRMHDHEEDLQYNLEVCRSALVNGNCSSWEQVIQNADVHTSGDPGKEECSEENPDTSHPPGDQGCPDPLPDPKTCNQASDRSSWPCAISFDEHTWAAPSCTPQTITAARLTFHNDDKHAHVADAIWILEGPSCTIQGNNPQGTTTVKTAEGTTIQTATTTGFSFTNLPAGRTYTVESDGATITASTLCLNSTTCHTPVNSTNTAFQTGKNRQVVNCPADGFVDVNFHAIQEPTATPTTVPQMCRQDIAITLPAAPTPAVDMNLKIRVKFQGVLLANIANEAWKTQPVKVTVIKQLADPTTNQGAQTIFAKSFENVQVHTTGETDSRGIAIWEGTFVANGLASGENYSVLVKGPKHLQRKFCAQNPTDRAEEGFPYRCLGAGTLSISNNTTLDFASVLLFAGDLPGGTAGAQDGIVNAYDVSLVLNMIRNGLSRGAEDIRIADMDLNGVVNAKDRGYLVETLEEKYGDEE